MSAASTASTLPVLVVNRSSQDESLDQPLTIPFEDETSFRRLPPLPGMWMRRREKARVEVPESNGKLAFYGVLEPLTRDLYGPDSESQELLHRSVPESSSGAVPGAGAADMGSREAGAERFVFTWEGQDEMDPMTGSGWMTLKGKDEVAGLIKLHLGDRSAFKAKRAG